MSLKVYKLLGTLFIRDVLENISFCFSWEVLACHDFFAHTTIAIFHEVEALLRSLDTTTIERVATYFNSAFLFFCCRGNACGDSIGYAAFSGVLNFLCVQINEQHAHF